MSILLAALALLQSPLDERSPSSLAFVGVHVLPMDTERVLRDQTVLVVGGRIARVGPVAEVELPAGTQRIEGRGRFLIPGLVDSHVHVYDEGDLFVYVANGITTVRNLMGLPWHLELRERIAAGEIVGPRLVTAGPFVNEPQQRTVEDVQRAVSEQVEAGYDCIKIHGPLSLAAYQGLLEEAALAGIPVVGHVPRNLPIERVLELHGQAEISHGEEYLYTYFDRSPDNTKPESIAAIAAATAAAGIAVTPNLVAFRSIVRQIEDLGRELARPEMAWVAPPFGRSWKPDLNRYRRDFEAADAEPMAARYALLERLTKALAAAGVRLRAGSDAMNPGAVPGFSLHEELELLVAAGLTPYQALRAATASAGEFLGHGGDEVAGVVAEKARADLVLLAANPLEDIARTRALEGVLLRGRWFPKEELAQGLAERARDYAREEPFMGRIDAAGIEAALAYRRELRAQDPHAFVFRPEGIEALVFVYLSLGDPRVARQAGEVAVEEFPARWTAWSRLGEAWAALGDKPAARAALERALELHPGDARLARALADVKSD